MIDGVAELGLIGKCMGMPELEMIDVVRKALVSRER